MPLSRDLKQIKENGSATAAEMAEFLAQLRGRRPHEVLGIVAGNGLTRGIVIATAWTIALIAVFTAGPYFWPKMFPPAEQPVARDAPPAAPAAEQPAAAQPAAPQPAAVATPAAPAAATPPIPSKDVLDKLGIGEAKSADPKVNPLENKADDLLKDLK